MKTKLILTVLFIMLAIGGTLVTRAMAFPGDGSWRQGSCGESSGHSHQQRLDKMARVLELTKDQQQQIASIFAAARDASQPIRETLRENRQTMRVAASSDPLDQDKIRALAIESGHLKAELLIQRVETRKQVSAILTTEQRELMEKIRPLLEENPGKHHKHHRGPGPGPSEPADS